MERMFKELTSKGGCGPNKALQPTALGAIMSAAAEAQTLGPQGHA